MFCVVDTKAAPTVGDRGEVKRGAKAETAEKEVKRVEDRALENFIVNDANNKICDKVNMQNNNSNAWKVETRFSSCSIYLRHLLKIPHTKAANVRGMTTDAQ